MQRFIFASLQPHGIEMQGITPSTTCSQGRDQSTVDVEVGGNPSKRACFLENSWGDFREEKVDPDMGIFMIRTFHEECDGTASIQESSSISGQLLWKSMEQLASKAKTSTTNLVKKVNVEPQGWMCVCELDHAKCTNILNISLFHYPLKMSDQGIGFPKLFEDLCRLPSATAQRCQAPHTTWGFKEMTGFSAPSNFGFKVQVRKGLELYSYPNIPIMQLLGVFNFESDPHAKLSM